ncbi:MAG: hypothetical protein WCA30_14905, partial [Dermatophilaceae bacterium]
MPRTVEEILAHADELAEKFEKYDPKPGTSSTPAPSHSCAPRWPNDPRPNGTSSTPSAPPAQPA